MIPKQSVCSKSKLGENPGGSEILVVNNLALASPHVKLTLCKRKHELFRTLSRPAQVSEHAKEQYIS
jgi:hypothetical protein